MWSRKAPCCPRSARTFFCGWDAWPERSKKTNTATNWRRRFEQIEVEPTRIYRIDDAREFLSGQGIDVDAIASEVDGKFHERVHPRREARVSQPTSKRRIPISAPEFACSQMAEIGLDSFQPPSRLSTGYTGRMEFEWDPGKAADNLRKHKVSFIEAAPC